MKTNTKSLSFAERATLTSNPTAKRLFSLMEEKRSNLCIAADVTNGDALLALADALGSEICILKTHIDIVESFTPELTQSLQSIAEKHNFLIFEDRKFADIGNTVAMQYQAGAYHISEWASIIDAHTLPGPGIIEGLKKVGLPLGRGLLLLAEISSKGNLLNDSYTQQTVALAEEYSDFVIGFISRKKITEDPRFIHLTPGVKMEEGIDSLGHQYLTPEKVITEDGSDIIIVGRDIIAADDPLAAARDYRNSAWNAYQERL